jgi:tRNA threonylcarbamoyladenosine biosynthesis protein TsaE
LEQLTYNLSEIKKVARQLWGEYSSKKIWALQATMGSGKTTFIHALCDILKVSDVVGSPTFAIINEYASDIAGTIFHMDWYRIKDEEEAVQAGCEDCIESGVYCFIEWPEKFPQLLPENTLHILLEAISNSERRITILSSLI